MPFTDFTAIDFNLSIN